MMFKMADRLLFRHFPGEGNLLEGQAPKLLSVVVQTVAVAVRPASVERIEMVAGAVARRVAAVQVV